MEKIKNHPKLKKRFSEIIDVAENASGELIRADEAEGRAIEEVRKLGREIVEEWAKNQHTKLLEEFKESKDKTREHVKKNFTGKQRLGE